MKKPRHARPRQVSPALTATSLNLPGTDAPAPQSPKESNSRIPEATANLLVSVKLLPAMERSRCYAIITTCGRMNDLGCSSAIRVSVRQG